MAANNSQSFITEHQVAELLAVSVTTVRKWRLQRRGPVYVKVEGSVRYCADDIAEYIKNRRVCGVEEAIPAK
jgi:predicted DNA-binding transcriptional regulator AlpA